MSTVDKIFELLDQRGYQQKDLTDYLQLDKGVSSQWKKGKSKSYRKYIVQIAAFLNVSVAELLEENTINEKNTPVVKDGRSELHDDIDKLSESKIAFARAYIQGLLADDVEDK